MATAKDILDSKGSNVVTVSPQTSVFDAAVLMNEHRIGALVVINGEHVIGMFTERDILRRVVARCRDAATTAVHEVMSDNVVVCYPDTEIDEVRAIMKDRRIRHLPVVEEGNRLVGLISIGDLNAHQANHQEYTIHLLHEYIYGQV